MTPQELKTFRDHLNRLEAAQVPWKHLAASIESDEKVQSVFACKFEGLAGGCVVTNRRLLVVGGGSLGSLRKKKEQVDLASITQVRSSSLNVTVAGGGAHLELSMVNRAGDLVSTINAARRQPVASADPPPVGPPLTPSGTQQADDPTEAIRKLAELRDAGVLTPEEFEAKKTELLGRI